jgi:hypothetical protein
LLIAHCLLLTADLYQQLFAPIFPKKYLMETTKPDLFEQQRQQGLPGMLNVLTILTFIGCGISYLSLLYSFFTSGSYQKQMVKLQRMRDDQGENSVGYKIAEVTIEMAKKSYDNRYVILISGLIFTTMCLYGALQMRKLKKTGFAIYTIGELAPLAVTALLVGFSLLGGFMILIPAIFAVLFVILYATQLKYMTR